jgi:hypothetical protein
MRVAIDVANRLECSVVERLIRRLIRNLAVSPVLVPLAFIPKLEVPRVCFGTSEWCRHSECETMAIRSVELQFTTKPDQDLGALGIYFAH